MVDEVSAQHPAIGYGGGLYWVTRQEDLATGRGILVTTVDQQGKQVDGALAESGITNSVNTGLGFDAAAGTASGSCVVAYSRYNDAAGKHEVVYRLMK